MQLMPSDVEAPKVLATMGHPLRWAILSHLARSDQRVGELTQLVGEPQNLVSYHLRELRDAGLVSSRRSSFDGRDTYYRVEPRPLRRALLSRAPRPCTRHCSSCQRPWHSATAPRA